MNIGSSWPRLKKKAPTQWSSFNPLVKDGVVWVGNKQGDLLGFDLGSGEERGRYKVDGTVRGFTFVDGIAYVGTLSGKLHCLKRF